MRFNKVSGPKPEALSQVLDAGQHSATISDVVAAVRANKPKPLLPTEPQAWPAQMRELVLAGELEQDQPIGQYSWYRVACGKLWMNVEIRTFDEVIGKLPNSKATTPEEWDLTEPPIVAIDFDVHNPYFVNEVEVYPQSAGHIDLYTLPRARVSSESRDLDASPEMRAIAEYTGLPMTEGAYSPDMFTDDSLYVLADGMLRLAEKGTRDIVIEL